MSKMFLLGIWTWSS